MSDDCAFWLDYSDGGPSPVLRYSAPIKMGWAPETVVPPRDVYSEPYPVARFDFTRNLLTISSGDGAGSQKKPCQNARHTARSDPRGGRMSEGYFCPVCGQFHGHVPTHRERRALRRIQGWLDTRRTSDGMARFPAEHGGRMSEGNGHICGARCRGLLGWLFGHRFYSKPRHYVPVNTSYCVRCGMPIGGWRRS